MEAIEAKLRAMFADVSDGNMPVDDAVKFLKEELLVSYKNGLAAGKPQRKTMRPQGKHRRALER